MKLTWYGHSCFRLSWSGGSLVFDPYAPGSVPGLALPEELEADKVLCSHDHRDHGYARGVRLTGREPDAVISRLDCWHDERQGALRGPNRIHVVEAEGLRLAHLGDLGHPLSPEQLRKLGPVDVLLIPVGGYYTIDAVTADRVARDLGAPVVIPMHYRGALFGYEVIGPVEDFLALRDDVRCYEGCELELSPGLPAQTAVLRCPVSKN